MAFWPRIVEAGDSTIALFFCGAAFAMAVFIAAISHPPPRPIRSPGPLDSLRSFQVDFSFYLDQLSLVMLLVVTGVGF